MKILKKEDLKLDSKFILFYALGPVEHLFIETKSGEYVYMWINEVHGRETKMGFKYSDLINQNASISDRAAHNHIHAIISEEVRKAFKSVKQFGGWYK